ncbi:hypothetical protein HOG48_02775, partial [Candidatus Peregrinibacteria bacterium]|nr:hypothetical protein [Candidatus Peregrinibacteria bacterium]
MEQKLEVEQIKKLNINIENAGEYVYFYPKAIDKEIDVDNVESITDAINKMK